MLVLSPAVARRADYAPGRCQWGYPAGRASMLKETFKMAIDPSLICWFQGDYVPLTDAKVGILTHGFSYGTGCFEGIRGYYNADREQLYLFRLEEHYARLQQSARIIMVDVP